MHGKGEFRLISRIRSTGTAKPNAEYTVCEAATKAMRNRGAQALHLSSVFSNFEMIEQCSDGFLIKKIFFEYRIGRAIESVKLLILGMKYSPLKNKKATLLNDWWK